MPSVAIVGAGLSGSLLAIQMLRRGVPELVIRLIDRSGTHGRGVAYGTRQSCHRLNVRSGGMSAFRDQPRHFVDWLNDTPGLWAGLTGNAGDFVPRHVYGSYIQWLLAAERAKHPDATLDLVAATVVSCAEQDGCMRLTLAGGDALTADIVVLATGNPPPLARFGLQGTQRYRADPWEADALKDLDDDAPVLLIGTGLTSVDMVLSLLERGHRGPIHALSRRGLLPQPHAASLAEPVQDGPSLDQRFPVAPLALLRMMRRQMADRAAAGLDWRPTVDAMRPFTSDIWQLMSPAQQGQFLRHLRPWWDSARHRMAPDSALRIAAAQQAGRFRPRAGRITHITEAEDRLRVRYLPRRAALEETIDIARLINCSGPGSDYRKLDDPVAMNLLDHGLARPDPLRLGLDVSANCAVRDHSGAVSRRLFAVGPVTKAAFWEMVAVPDIRRQCEILSAHLAGLLLISSFATAASSYSDMFVI